MIIEMIVIILLGVFALIVGFFYFKEWGKAIQLLSMGPPLPPPPTTRRK